MDANAIVSLASNMAATRFQAAAQMAVMKKALDMQGEGVLQLLQAATPASNNPPNLGNQIDTYA